jgi:hypothetical protein
MHVPVSIRTSYFMANKKALVDSGATDNFMHPAFAKRMGLGLQKLQAPKKIFNIDNTTNVTVSPSPQSKEEENDKLHKLRRYARDFQRQHTTDAERFNWDSDDEDYGLAIGRLVVT